MLLLEQFVSKEAVGGTPTAAKSRTNDFENINKNV